MTSGEDWLLRPVIEQLCKFESLIDGTLDLADIATLNEALSVRDENTARAREASQ